MSFLCQNEPVNEALITAARCFPHQVARVKPSKTQLKVLDSIRVGEQVTAVEVAARCSLSTSFASTLLKTLMQKGYLTRKAMTERTGGVEFGYLVL
ncbi:MarR family transcriptional regulator [Vibrio cholerae]|uniref:MarR family transcriptional regulator n=1 Tax=Vibrio cholerae TaxID=666 RepID=UPI002932F6FA|nr:MarR family transcriptional regulator [Vibrio cholerae]ELP4885333.1 MarR family transcriptional regulator [Vibrio cholerae]ELT8458671.1 MarR family transcriptional regulator [Vibrio cholerae]MEB5514720.1 MarR family transcriptional regulator [Vibrio cholerae]